MVGDGGALGSKGAATFLENLGADWIAPIRSASVKKLIAEPFFPLPPLGDGAAREYASPSLYPGERLAVWRNLANQNKKAAKRQKALAGAAKLFERIKRAVAKGRLKDQKDVALAVGGALSKRALRKSFILDIRDAFFDYSLDEEFRLQESQLDGPRVARTSAPAEALTIEDCARACQNMARAPKTLRAARSRKFSVWPNLRHSDKRFKARIFLTALSYYVEWRLRDAWGELISPKAALAPRGGRDPEERAKAAENPSASASFPKNGADIPTITFARLLKNLKPISTARVSFMSFKGEEAASFDLNPDLTPLQIEAYRLLEKIPTRP